MMRVTKNTVFSVVLAVLLIGSLAGGAVGAVAAQPDSHALTPEDDETTTNSTTTTGTTGTTTTETPGEDTNSTTTDDADTGSSTPDTPARVFPVRQQQEWMSVEQADTGVYNTSGPTVIFEAAEGIDHVSVREPGAAARIVGDRMLIVEYDSDAAAPGKSTLIHVDIVDSSGARSVLELHATKTNVEAGANDLQQYRGAILSELDKAEAAGYERSAEGLKNYHDRLREIKDVFNSLFVEKSMEAVAWVVAGAMNPIVVLGALLGIVGLITWLLRRFSESIRILEEDPGREDRLRREIQSSFESDQNTAADTRLRDVSKVGRSGEIYWEDAFSVGTLVEMGELARGELPVRVRDGEVETIGGVAGVSASDIDQSWLEKVTRPGRLPSSEIAVAQLRAALHRLITEHGLGHIYRDAYAECDRLLDELDQTHTAPTGELGDSSTGPAGGDD